MAVDQLIKVLEQLNTVYSNMLTLADSKTNAIKENQVDTVVQIMNQESKSVKLVEQLEHKRAEVTQLFLHSRGIKSQLELNVTELSKLVFDLEERERLLNIQSTLSGTLLRLKEKNDLNQQLIKQSLDFIDLSLDLLTGKPSQDITYQHPGERSSNTGRTGLFDTRA
ncbi:flagellar protein FlgN [Paenibacillus lemnae]|uniref:Flagellar protein FlgN n=1 Tax=Paenibacillus lemnae TaxID=1330551 RepID=A0A848M9N8_PAELE|nr:flagellar protein FlgN [Paenibacillus lemnae]NMO96613.1 flagellar protein FlgN [Paenibacillus lemnae]